MRFRVACRVLLHTFEGSCQGTKQQLRSALRRGRLRHGRHRHGHLRHDHRAPKKPRIHPKRCGCRCLYRTPRVLFLESCGHHREHRGRLREHRGRHREHRGRHREHHGHHRGRLHENHTGRRGHHVHLLPSTCGLLLHSLPQKCGLCFGELLCRGSSRHREHRGRLLPSR